MRTLGVKSDSTKSILLKKRKPNEISGQVTVPVNSFQLVQDHNLSRQSRSNICNGGCRTSIHAILPL